jgi:hypothetical protein
VWIRSRGELHLFPEDLPLIVSLLRVVGCRRAMEDVSPVIEKCALSRSPDQIKALRVEFRTEDLFKPSSASALVEQQSGKAHVLVWLQLYSAFGPLERV